MSQSVPKWPKSVQTCPKSVQNCPKVFKKVQKYAYVIYEWPLREQDTRIVHISQANIYLQQELANSKQQAEDMAINVQTLQDQNSLLKAQNNNSAVSVPHNGMPKSVPDPAQ